MSTVSALVVAYRSAATLGACLESLIDNGVSEIIIVDNASPEPYDRSRTQGDAKLREVSLGRNLGFGRAMNYAASLTTSQVLLICNPDVVFQSGAVDQLLAVLNDPSVGVAAPKILNGDGSRYPSFRIFPPLWVAGLHGIFGQIFPNNPASVRYRSSAKDPAHAVRVPWVSGAMMAMSRETFLSIGGFDPRYFLYLEDVDLCRRIGLRHLEVVYEPASVVIHHQGTSSSQRPLRSLVAHHRSLAQYASSQTTNFPTFLLASMGIGARFLISVVRAVSQNRGVKR